MKFKWTGPHCVVPAHGEFLPGAIIDLPEGKPLPKSLNRFLTPLKAAPAKRKQRSDS